MFLDSIKRIFGVEPTESEARPDSAPAADPLHLAACALLLDVAYADGEFTEEERAHLERTLARHFELSPEDGRRLLELAEAERRAAVDQYQFTSVLKEGYDLGQKMVLAEVMWGLVLADGEIAEHEHYMTRKIANLLDLKPGYLSRAKKAAATRSTRSGDG
ncbi:MAG TPA: TerB family tellurite resistance protein [Longimicrobiales bacterium]